MSKLRSKKPSLYSFENWTKLHDIYLIENNHLDIETLMLHLPFGQEEIMARRKALGLITRIKQLKKMTNREI